MTESTNVRIILIGCGPHAKRIYLPALQKLANVELSLVIELKGKEQDLSEQREQLKSTDFWFIDAFEKTLPNYISRKLSEYVHTKRITGVIIATEPLVHVAYSLWALSNNLNILLDKPISTYRNVTTCTKSANSILTDYLDIMERYDEVQKTKETAFIIHSQRRFHDGFEFVKSQLNEVAKRTGCPVTFIQAYHCDGQWRLPSEIVTQEYHPYCYGYGKASHSGYHIFDTVYQLYKSAVIEDKMADKMEIVSSFVQPNGFFKQLNEKDYHRIFGELYNEVKGWSDEELSHICKDFGEIDLSSIINLIKEGQTVANFSINLLHNGFAGRTWMYPGTDLYKGNGRIKHESYQIQQGPFQNIQIHAYQGSDRHDDQNGVEDHLGGKNHFDVFVFRNPMISNGNRSPERYHFSDLAGQSSNDSMIKMESVKFKVVEDFIDYLSGKKNKDQLKSKIEDHLIPVKIMSGIYRSHIQRKANEDCIVKYDFNTKMAEVV